MTKSKTGRVRGRAYRLVIELGRRKLQFSPSELTPLLRSDQASDICRQMMRAGWLRRVVRGRPGRAGFGALYVLTAAGDSHFSDI